MEVKDILDSFERVFGPLKINISEHTFKFWQEKTGQIPAEVLAAFRKEGPKTYAGKSNKRQ